MACACKAPAVMMRQSIVNPKPHAVCVTCGDEELRQCYKKVGVTVEEVSAAQRLGTVERRSGVTFTIRKMSGKGIRMVARYLAILKHGGFLEDRPEQFYERWSDLKPELGRRALEQVFAASTDKLEEKLRDEEGFMSSAVAQKVAAFVEKKLEGGMWIEGEVAADHHRDGVAKPTASKVVSSKDISTMVVQLKKATDPEIRRKLRRQLRKLGHRGGARE